MSDLRQFYVGPIKALRNRNLTPGDRCVLDALCAHTNEEGICWPSVETIQDFAGGISDRSVRRSLRVLEEEKLVRTWKVGARNYYQVLFDVPADVAARAAIAEENRTPVSGVASEKRHRTGVSGEEGPDAGVRTGQGGPVEGTGASGETGHLGPGERVQEQRTELTTTDAREDSAMTAPARSDTTGDTAPSLLQHCIDLAVAVNRALRDNPATASQAQLYPIRADRAATPLKGWLEEGIPFDLIRETCAAVAARFKPAQRGHHISTFTYFENPIREAWEKSKANAAVEAAGPAKAAPAAPAKKIRRLSA